MATGVHVTALLEGEDVVLGSETIILGNVLPGEFSVVLDVMVITPNSGFAGMLNVRWGEIGNPNTKEGVFEFQVWAQSSKIDWGALEYGTPYSIDVAEGDQFIGRDEKVRSLAAKLLRRPMESFYITGQKRVGKTSLALAAAEFAKANAARDALDYKYILWGSVAHSDAGILLRRLGEKIHAFIVSHLPAGIQGGSGGLQWVVSSLD